MRVKILIEKASTLESKINREIEKLEYNEQEIIDIKFAVKEDSIYDSCAMIIYKDKDSAR